MLVVKEIKGGRSGARNEENRSEEMLTGLGLSFSLSLPTLWLPYYQPHSTSQTYLHHVSHNIAFPKASNYVTAIQHPSTTPKDELHSTSNHTREKKPITSPRTRPLQSSCVPDFSTGAEKIKVFKKGIIPY